LRDYAGACVGHEALASSSGLSAHDGRRRARADVSAETPTLPIVAEVADRHNECLPDSAIAAQLLRRVTLIERQRDQRSGHLRARPPRLKRAIGKVPSPPEVAEHRLGPR
jgi:hypothetical protein